MYSVLKKVDNTNIMVTETIAFSIEEVSNFISIFENYKRKGAIPEDIYFYDKQWYISNSIEMYPLVFDIDEVAFREQAKKRNFIFKYEELILALKCFVLLIMQDTALVTIKAVCDSIIWILRETNYFDVGYIRTFRKTCKTRGEGFSHIRKLSYTTDFLDYFEALDVAEIYYSTCINLEIELSNDFTRSIPDFESMFKFDRIINKFIETVHDQEEREEFLPIIIWWKVTSIVPFRTTEFTLTPYDCVVRKDGKYKFVGVKSIIKGQRTANLKESIFLENCYREQDFAINQQIWDLINEYKSIVDKYDYENDYYGNGRAIAEQRKFLLSRRSYYKYAKNGKGNMTNASFLDYFSPSLLLTLLSKFYTIYVKGEYHFDVVDECTIPQCKDNKKVYSDLEEFQIRKIQPMDTRHLAIMNMVMSDISPVAIKILAGHRNINSIYHYYNHIDTYIYNYTYYLAKKNVKGFVDGEILSLKKDATPDAKVAYFLPKIKCGEIKAKEVNGGNGWCIYQKDDCKPCRQHEHRCECGCQYYIPEENRTAYIDEAISENKKKIESSVETIRQILKDRKIIKNYESRIRTEVNLIRSCAEQNADIIQEHVFRAL